VKELARARGHSRTVDGGEVPLERAHVATPVGLVHLQAVAARKADPKQRQDWFLKRVRGGRGQPLAVRRATLWTNRW
jgi:hypothetical protein